MSARPSLASVFALCLAVASPAATLAQDAPAPTPVAPVVAAAPVAAPVVAAPVAAPAVPAAPVAAAAPAVPVIPSLPVTPDVTDAPVAVDLSSTGSGDRVTFGQDAIVRAGEHVRDVVTMGGDARVEGEVLGSVVTMGGDATILGHVVGDVVTMGGDAELAPGARVDGEVTTMGGTLDASTAATTGSVVTMGDTDVAGLAALGTIGGLAAFVHSALSGAASFALLFLLGLGLLGLARDRFDATKVVIAREPLHVLMVGAASFVGAVLAIIALAITLVGLPMSLLVALALSLGCYVGLASVAAVIGAVLPIERLKDRPILQLAAGVATLYLASLVPGIGTVALAVAGAVGLGAVVRTRLRTSAPPSIPATPSGPYRTSSYPEGA